MKTKKSPKTPKLLFFRYVKKQKKHTDGRDGCYQPRLTRDLGKHPVFGASCHCGTNFGLRIEIVPHLQYCGTLPFGFGVLHWLIVHAAPRRVEKPTAEGEKNVTTSGLRTDLGRSKTCGQLLESIFKASTGAGGGAALPVIGACVNKGLVESGTATKG